MTTTHSCINVNSLLMRLLRQLCPSQIMHIALKRFNVTDTSIGRRYPNGPAVQLLPFSNIMVLIRRERPWNHLSTIFFTNIVAITLIGTQICKELQRADSWLSVNQFYLKVLLFIAFSYGSSDPSMHAAVELYNMYWGGNQSFFVFVPPDENSLQLPTPKVAV
jgi:hypothetical protein